MVARELTKRFETIHRCRLGEAPAWLAADPDRARGEFVLIIDAPEATIAAEDDVDACDHVLSALLAELPVAQAVRLAMKLTGAPRNRLYERALKLSKNGRSSAVR